MIISLLIIFYPRNYLMKFNKTITIDYSNLNLEEKWEYDQDNECVKLYKYDKNIWKFTSNKNGKCTLIFYYNRENEKYKYKIVYVLKVNNDKIIWEKGEGFGLLDYPNPY